MYNLKLIKKSLFLIVTSFSGLFFVGSSAQALDVFVDFDGDIIHDADYFVNIGDVFTGTVYANVDAAHGGLAGFGVLMQFNEPPITISDIPNKASNVVTAPLWGFLPTSSSGLGSATSGGSILGFPTGLSGSVPLFDITFLAENFGSSLISMTDENQGFSDFAGFDAFDYDASGELNFLASTVHVVPIPPAIYLFFSGLSCLWMSARRRFLKA